MTIKGLLILLTWTAPAEAQAPWQPPPAEWCRRALSGDPSAWPEEPSPSPERAAERLELARRWCADMGTVQGAGQHEHEGQGHNHHHEHHHHHEMTGALAPVPATQEASGTSWQPADSQSHKNGMHGQRGPWSLMAHGNATAAATRQGGPRGGSALFSTSMVMGSARRKLGPGQLQLRAMGSLEPAMGPRGYPLLLQTGETADGKTPLRDRQHPHDLAMELAASYSVRLGGQGSVFGYVGLPGEPALGPPVFMHRESGLDNPQAPISHHHVDATHISYGVATAGAVWSGFKVDASAFNGREPDEKRWGLERPRFDSYSYRLTWNLSSKTSFQVSRGHLKSPEGLHPDVDAVRTTLSGTLSHPVDGRPWQTTVAWGRNTHNPGRALDAYLVESNLKLGAKTFFGRFERAEKDDLANGHGRGHEAPDSVTVGSLSGGIVYDVFKTGPLRYGIGGLLSRAFIPDSLKPLYGSGPVSAMVWLRIKLSKD